MKCKHLCLAMCGSNDGDVLVDVLLPRMAVLGAQPEDILILNFGVWIDHEQARIFASRRAQHSILAP